MAYVFVMREWPVDVLLIEIELGAMKLESLMTFGPAPEPYSIAP